MNRTTSTTDTEPQQALTPAPVRPAFSFGRMLVLAQRRFRAQQRQQIPVAA